MCEVLILGKFSNSFKTHLGNKSQSDTITELKKITKSFDGSYVLRRSEYDGCAIVKFECENKCNQFLQCLDQCEYFKYCKMLKLQTLEQLENKFINVQKACKITNKEEGNA
jgi:hypothetical protein